MHERDRHRRIRQAQGGFSFHHRQRPLHRRHQPSRPGLRLFRALAARARRHRQDRRLRGAGFARRGRGADWRGYVADKIGAHICGWTVTFQGRHADESGAVIRRSPTARRCYVGDPVAVVIAETLSQARDAAEKVDVDYGVLPAVVDPAARGQAGRAANSRVRAQQHDLQLASRRRRPRPRPRSPAAKHVTKLDIINNRLMPNAMEPRAALGRIRRRHRRLHAAYDEPESARRARSCSRRSSASRPSTSCA